MSSDDDVQILTDVAQCQQTIIQLFRHATSTIYYSTFLCDFNHAMVDTFGSSVTMKDLIHQAVKRNVKVYILYNPVCDYGTSSTEKLRCDLPSEVQIHGSVSNLGPSFVTKHFSNNSKYAYHHQKYLCVDGDLPDRARMMVTGCDVNSERAGWLEKNGWGYFWHELGAVFNCSTELYSYIASHHCDGIRRICGAQMVPAPFPLVNGGWTEENLMVELITTAERSIQLENQNFISGGGWQENRIAQALVHRVCKAIEADDDFYALVLSNVSNQDEPSFGTRKYCEISMKYTVSEIEALAEQRGLARQQLYSRLFIGGLEHDGIPVKVHSNIIIQDGMRAIRTSSNLSDRSLSHRPCDVELGVMLQGSVVHNLQQELLEMYVGVKQSDYSIKQIVQELQHQLHLGVIYPTHSRSWSRWWTNSVMGFFVSMSEGATGGRYNVTFETTECN